MKYSGKNYSGFKLRRGYWGPALNLEGRPGVPLLNFEVGSEFPSPGVLVPLLHNACLFTVWNLFLTTSKKYCM